MAGFSLETMEARRQWGDVERKLSSKNSVSDNTVLQKRKVLRHSQKNKSWVNSLLVDLPQRNSEKTPSDRKEKTPDGNWKL